MFVLVFLAATAFATPGIPHQFYGNATINGTTAPNGTTIIAKVNNQTYTTTTNNGTYGFSPDIFFVNDPDFTNEGEQIVFTVNGVNASTFNFENGGYTNLNLAITQENPPGPGPQPEPEPSPAPSGGGGGGGGEDSTLLKVSPLSVSTGKNVSIQALCKWSFGCRVYSDGELIGDIVSSSGYQKFEDSYDTPGNKKVELYWKGTTDRLVANKTVKVTGEAINQQPLQNQDNNQDENGSKNTGNQQGNATELGQPTSVNDTGNNPQDNNPGIPSTGFFGLSGNNFGLILGGFIVIVLVLLAALFVGKKKKEDEGK